MDRKFRPCVLREASDGTRPSALLGLQEAGRGAHWEKHRTWLTGPKEDVLKVTPARLPQPDAHGEDDRQLGVPPRPHAVQRRLPHGQPLLPAPQGLPDGPDGRGADGRTWTPRSGWTIRCRTCSVMRLDMKRRTPGTTCRPTEDRLKRAHAGRCRMEGKEADILEQAAGPGAAKGPGHHH